MDFHPCSSTRLECLLNAVGMNRDEACKNRNPLFIVMEESLKTINKNKWDRLSQQFTDLQKAYSIGITLYNFRQSYVLYLRVSLAGLRV